MPGLSVIAVILSICGDAGAVAQYLLSDSFSGGPGGYANNILFFEVSPNSESALNVYGGRTRVSDPVPDTTRSLGFGGWLQLTRKLDLSVDYNNYNGAKAHVMRLPTMEMSGEKPDRLRVGTLTGIIGLDLLKGDGSGGEEGEEGKYKSKLSLGFSSASHRMPVFIERFAPLKGAWIGRELSPYTVADRAYSAVLSLGNGTAMLAGNYRRHHYTFPPPPSGADRPQVRRIVESIKTATINALPSFPRYECGGSLRLQLPARIGSLLSYDYFLSDLTPRISRYITGELSWEAFTWLELRGGSYWIREYRETTRYTTMGLSLFF